MRFLLVEDNAQLARAVCERFALDGHAVDHATGLMMPVLLSIQHITI